MGFSLKKLAKKAVKVAVAAPAGLLLGKNTKKALDNIEKKGLKAFSIGQISGQDRAKLLAKREEAAALADTGPQGDLTPTEMPTMDMEAVQEYKRRKLLEAQARGGRQSTMLTNKDG